jgi:hypothetical protein
MPTEPLRPRDGITDEHKTGRKAVLSKVRINAVITQNAFGLPRDGNRG